MPTVLPISNNMVRPPQMMVKIPPMMMPIQACTEPLTMG